MIAILIILFIVECGAFCYLFYKILEMDKDINILYDYYSKELERVTKINLKTRRTMLNDVAYCI